MNNGLLLSTKDDKQIPLDLNSYLFFVDETGDESLRDSCYPVFGLGGCGISCKDYSNHIRYPWISMKSNFFGSSNIPLHASELKLKNLSNKQLNGISEVFKKCKFSRIAVTISDRVPIDSELNIYQILAPSLLNRIADITKWNNIQSISVIFEKSDRGDHLAKKYFSGYKFFLDNKIEIPFHKFFMNKKHIEPGLEIADFIMHAAGTQTRNEALGMSLKKRKDFLAVFGSVDNKLSSYLHVKSVTWNKPVKKV